MEGLGGASADWSVLFTVVCLATLALGNLVAIVQTNIKRMLAYSSIAHAGYILMAFVPYGDPAVAQQSVAAGLFYLVAYALTNFGTWGVVIALERADGRGLAPLPLAEQPPTKPDGERFARIDPQSVRDVPMLRLFCSRGPNFSRLVRFHAIAPAAVEPGANPATEVLAAFDNGLPAVKVPEFAPIKAESTIRTGTGVTGYFRNTIEIEFTEPDKVPREYCSPDQKKVLDAIKRGVESIEGVKITKDKNFHTRG